MAVAEFSQLRKSAGFSKKEVASKYGYDIRHIYRFENGSTVPRDFILEDLRSIVESKVEAAASTGFTFIDLFAGIGGLRLAFESVGGKCIYTSEWNKFAAETYVTNFHDEPEHLFDGDITTVNEEDIPEHDVLLAGFPCQPFSVAGVSKKNSLGQNHGFASETQGTLFFDILRILRAKRPKVFLLENVKNLETHDGGRTFEIIMSNLNLLDYHVQYRVIDAQHFLPQHRERIIIIGFQDATSFSLNNLVLPEKGQIPLRAILHPGDGSEQPETNYTQDPNGTVASKYILTDKLWAYLQEYAQIHKAKGNGFGYSLVTENDISRTLSARYYKDGSEILVWRGHGNNPRRLTPRECARLMGFPDSFVIPVSDTQAYKQFGNSVAVPLFRQIASAMQQDIFLSLESDVVYQNRLPLTVGV